MKEKYIVPDCEIIEFNKEDIISTSGILDGFGSGCANEDQGWSGLY